jgi:hypothetical protein
VLAFAAVIGMQQFFVAAAAAMLLMASPSAYARAGAPATFPSPTNSAGRQALNAEPDPACTPGAIFPDVTATQVCVPGYARSVRDMSVETKRQIYAEYGLGYPQAPGAYEVDHLVSLELAGSNDIANLWPEAAQPTPGFHQKDGFEDWLHDQVCSGAISLADAQTEIATDWLTYWTAAGSPRASSSAGNVGDVPSTVSPLPFLITVPNQAAGAVTPSATCVSYTGGQCMTQRSDGTWSSSTGRGTCSGHGGEAP